MSMGAKSSADLLEELRHNEIARRTVLNERRRAVGLEPVPVVESAEFAEAAKPPRRRIVGSDEDSKHLSALREALAAVKTAAADISPRGASVATASDIDEHIRHLQAEADAIIRSITPPRAEYQEHAESRPESATTG
jgi:hypothetical protein